MWLFVGYYVVNWVVCCLFCWWVGCVVFEIGCWFEYCIYVLCVVGKCVVVKECYLLCIDIIGWLWVVFIGYFVVGLWCCNGSCGWRCDGRFVGWNY